MQIEHTEEFRCTPERLWPYIEEPELQKKWMKGLIENRLTSEGPSRVGSRFRMKIKEGGRVVEFDGEVTAHDRPRHLAVRFWGGSFKPGMAMHADYRLSDLGGATRLDYAARLESERLGFFMKMMLPAFKLFASTQLRSFMKALRHEVEGNAT